MKHLKPMVNKMFKTEKRISNIQPAMMARVGSSYFHPPSAFNSGLTSPRNEKASQEEVKASNEQDQNRGKVLHSSHQYYTDRATNPESHGRQRINSSKINFN
jgi:hypothetical protein